MRRKAQARPHSGTERAHHPLRKGAGRVDGAEQRVLERTARSVALGRCRHWPSPLARFQGADVHPGWVDHAKPNSAINSSFGISQLADDSSSPEHWIC